MVIMTEEERKIAEFLTEKKFKWKLKPTISVIDMGDRLIPFSADFYLTDLRIYIKSCIEKINKNHDRISEIYENKKIPIIFVETYKDENKWKNYLLKRIEKIQES